MPPEQETAIADPSQKDQLLADELSNMFQPKEETSQGQQTQTQSTTTETAQSTGDAQNQKQSSQQQPNAETKTTPAQSEAKTTNLTKEDMRELLEGAARVMPVGQQKSSEQETKLTPEQIEERLNFWKPTDAFLQQLRSEDPKTQVAAFVALRDGLAKQILTMVNTLQENRLTEVLSPYEQRMAQLHADYTERQEAKLADQFFTKYPQYKGQDEFLRTVRSGIEAEVKAGVTKLPKNYEEAFDLLHTRANAVLSSLKLAGEQSAQAQAQGGNSGGGGRSRMSTLSGGGQGNVSASSGAKAGGGKGPLAEALDVFQ